MKKKWYDKLPEELDFVRTGRLPQKFSSESMEGKVCVITGTTSGVGHEAALRIARAGGRLVMIIRNREKGEKLCAEIFALTGHACDIHIADFSRLDEVRRAAEAILAKYPKIDVLINNAGVHMTTRQLTHAGHEMAFCVNHLASFLVTSLFLKRMVASAPARILYINSEGHRFNGLKIDDLTWAGRRYRGLQGYGASKTAKLMTIRELDELLQGTGVTINAMHPGAVKSNIGHNNGKLYNLYSKYIVQPALKDPKISGEAIYYLVSSPDLEGVSGKFCNLTNEEITATHARNRETGREIFRISKELTHLDKGNEFEI